MFVKKYAIFHRIQTVQVFIYTFNTVTSKELHIYKCQTATGPASGAGAVNFRY